MIDRGSQHAFKPCEEEVKPRGQNLEGLEIERSLDGLLISEEGHRIILAK
jgi:hypothetical protein